MIYLDDNFCDHPKVIHAESFHDRAPWLFVAGLGYCRRYLTGGLIPAPVVPTLVRNFKPTMKDGLVTAGLWDPIRTNGNEEEIPIAFQIHDYELWNSTEDSQKEARREKARNAGLARGEKARQQRTDRMAAARALGTHTPSEWSTLLRLASGLCVRCGEPFSKTNPVHKDHILPVYKGGSDAIDNLQPLCQKCNLSKGPEVIDFRSAELLVELKLSSSSAQESK